MRLSCNGCRALRKGCSSDCPIRPCLLWIKSPQSQENATLFLAKFYGRAGLINLINAAAPHLRPASFKSLLEEACGRIVSPILGCSGLLSSGRWGLCEAAVEAVLSGAPIITQLVSSFPSSDSMLKACDIRHVSNKGKGSSGLLHKVKKPPSNQFKRSGGRGKNKHQLAGVKLELEGCIGTEEWGSGSGSGLGSGVSHEHTSVGNGNGGEADCCSVETVEVVDHDHHAELELDLNLTLGWGPYNPKPSLDNSHALPSFFRFLN